MRVNAKHLSRLGRWALAAVPLALPFFVPLAGCSSGPQGPTTIDAGAYTLTVLQPTPAGSCNAHAEQPSHFTDNTAAWGLSGVAMGGYYAADLDRDGYPDIVALSGNATRETVPENGTNLPDGGFERDVAVFMNRPNGSGGRAFVDATQESGLFQTRDGSTTQYRVTQIAALADVNGDGALDAFVTVMDTTSADKPEIMLNDGHGHFSLAPQSDPSTTLEPQGYQAVFTDVDNDGVLDLLLTYWYKPNTEIGSQAQLFHGNGDGTFTSITKGAGLTTDSTGSTSSILAGTNSRPSFGATACDLNGDGYPELLISSYGGESNMLYVNDGAGNFKRFVQTGGFDGDTNVDYHDNQYFLCYCSGATSDPDCANAAKPMIACNLACNVPGAPANPQLPACWDNVQGSPAMLNGNNFSAACRDMNGDGITDVFQSTIRHWWAGNSTDISQLLLNRGTNGAIDLQRVDPTSSGITFPHIDPQGWNEGIQQIALVDMDNDGRPDVLAGGSDYAYQYGHLFAQQSDGTFQDVAQQWGMTFPCMDGLAVADYDRDGDLDVIVRGSLYRNCAAPGWPALSGKDPGFPGYTTNEIHIFTNDASDHSKWLELRLLASDGATNALGIGASVTVTANGVSQTQQVIGQHGIGSESDDPGVLFFGLGDCAGVDKIEVKWPNQAHTVDTWTNVPAGHLVELHQGDTTIYGVNL